MRLLTFSCTYTVNNICQTKMFSVANQTAGTAEALSVNSNKDMLTCNLNQTHHESMSKYEVTLKYYKPLDLLFPEIVESVAFLTSGLAQPTYETNKYTITFNYGDMTIKAHRKT